jgi:hypothetical protein
MASTTSAFEGNKRSSRFRVSTFETSIEWLKRVWPNCIRVHTQAIVKAGAMELKKSITTLECEDRNELHLCR